MSRPCVWGHMQLIESQARKLALKAARESSEYYQTRRFLDAALLLWYWLTIASSIALQYIILKEPLDRWTATAWYFALWCVEQYSYYVQFTILHEWIHRSSGCSFYFESAFLHSIVSVQSYLDYFALGHLSHHRFTGTPTTMIDIIRNMKWDGKDIDAVFEPMASTGSVWGWNRWLVLPVCWFAYSSPTMLIVMIFFTLNSTDPFL